ncbi:hypothetical protein [Saccharolobus solfataricus]|uniref:Uncharacterized protein n=2 Tax=Saccharolobus solfataricus TaxID=2287 RepID=A0A157T3F1_SACSO|nr:hypothetical protein [Saccharolobus solfataricus]SAI85381.1 uncharacterised protein [Saccharolobus solfataricus]
MVNIVLRILWSGEVTRVALEEARNMNAKLIVYRNAGQSTTSIYRKIVTLLRYVKNI